MLVGLYNKKDIVFYSDIATLVVTDVYQNSCDRMKVGV